jgi:cobalt-zinc-cadmium efflux system protein
MLIALGISVAFFIVEVAGGLLANSLALLADAGHVLTDIAAIGLALGAFWVAERPISPRRTFGFYRIESFAAVINGLMLWAIAAWVAFEAYQRLMEPPAVRTLTMVAVAVAGLVANAVVGLVLQGASAKSLNVRAAYLHVVTDALQSVAVIVAGLLMAMTGWFVVDPLASVLIALVMVVSGGRVLWEGVHVLMESTPRNLDVRALCERLERVNGVADVHDIHAWSITSGFEVLSCHVVTSRKTAEERAALLQQLREIADREFQINHITIQLEDTATGCVERHHVEHEASRPKAP